MKVISENDAKLVNGGWVWVAAGAVVSGAGYLSQKNKKKSLKGFAIAVGSGALGGGSLKVAGLLAKAGNKIMSAVQVGNATAAAVVSSNNPY